MITNDDVAKLQKVFTTKADLTAMEARQDKKYASKANLEQHKEDLLEAMDGKLAAQKNEILTQVNSKLATQLAAQKEEIVTEVGEYIVDTIVPLIEQRDKRMERVEHVLHLPPLQE